jgi:hypothetical protein
MTVPDLGLGALPSVGRQTAATIISTVLLPANDYPPTRPPIIVIDRIAFARGGPGPSASTPFHSTTFFFLRVLFL